MPALAEALQQANVKIKGDERTLLCVPGAVPAAQEDFGKEYLDYILSVKTVDSLDEAIAHINRYNTGHSDSILTENAENAERFLNEVDSACVYVNASTVLPMVLNSASGLRSASAPRNSMQEDLWAEGADYL